MIKITQMPADMQRLIIGVSITNEYDHIVCLVSKSWNGFVRRDLTVVFKHKQMALFTNAIDLKFNKLVYWIIINISKIPLIFELVSMFDSYMTDNNVKRIIRNFNDVKLLDLMNEKGIFNEKYCNISELGLLAARLGVINVLNYISDGFDAHIINYIAYKAAENNHVNIVDWAFARNADINGRYPHIAITNKYVELIEWLNKNVYYNTPFKLC